MDFRLTEEQALLRRTVREFAETEIHVWILYVRDMGTWGLTGSPLVPSRYKRQ